MVASWAYLCSDQPVSHQYFISSASRMVCTVQDMLTLLHWVNIRVVVTYGVGGERVPFAANASMLVKHLVCSMTETYIWRHACIDKLDD